ncbi:MAG TPA: SDR family oxidoreductase [Gemmatimonadales bacterium]|nr:SDR family oxidoreductase [Gemmatimonadales bacterium]
MESSTSGRPVAVVTGASAGIGKEFCVRLAARGYDLILVARDGNRLEALRAELEQRHGITADVFPADLSLDDDVSRLAGLMAGTSRLAMLVNNAGFGTRGNLADASPARQEAMLRLHTLAPMRLTQAALPVLLRNRKGAVVNVSSVASFLYSAGNVNYCATKAYLTNFSEGLAAELRGTGVQAQALCPGFTRSEFHQRMDADIESIPGWMWMSASRVVETSLRSLERGGPVVCVPGFRYKLAVLLLHLLPRRLIGPLARLRARQV